MSLMKGMEVPEAINPVLYFDLNEFSQETFENFSEYLQKKIENSKEYKLLEGYDVFPQE